MYFEYCRLCDSFGNQCFHLTMNKNNDANVKCSHCDYDCNRTQHTISFNIRKIDHEKFCAKRHFDAEYPITDIMDYIDFRPLLKKNPKLFYLKWKALLDGTEYQYNQTEVCYWKTMNDFAIVNVYLSTPTIPRMKQDVKVKLHEKFALLGNQIFLVLV